MWTYSLFIIGFALLIKGADWLVDGSASIARRLKISNLVIGLTIVAFGTSAPELVVNIIASTTGNTDIAIGNIIGSNICNILLILGISAMIYPLAVHWTTVWREIPFALLATIVVALMVNDIYIDHTAGSILSRIDGLVLICFFVIFLYYTISIARGGESNSEESIKEMGLARAVIYVLLGLAALLVGGNWIVNGAVLIALKLGMSQSLIGLTIVAVGTSLPELAASAMAAYKHQSDIAIGNVVGSNIFNIFWILGISAVIKPLPFNPINNIDVAMALFASLLLFCALFIGKRHTLQRWQGAAFILIYAAYVTFLIVQAK